MILFVVNVAWIHAQAVTEDQLTDAEKGALAEIQQKGLPWAAQRVAALEYILSAKPKTEMPTMVRTLTGDELHVSWSPPGLRIFLAPRKDALPPPIDWTVILPTSDDKHFVPRQGMPEWVWLVVAAAFMGGVAADRALK